METYWNYIFVIVGFNVIYLLNRLKNCAYDQTIVQQITTKDNTDKKENEDVNLTKDVNNTIIAINIMRPDSHKVMIREESISSSINRFLAEDLEEDISTNQIIDEFLYPSDIEETRPISEIPVIPIGMIPDQEKQITIASVTRQNNEISVSVN